MKLGLTWFLGSFGLMWPFCKRIWKPLHIIIFFKHKYLLHFQAQILDWFIKEYLKKCYISRLSASSLMLYLNNNQVYKVNFEYNVLILFRKSHYIGDSHYLVLFSIRTIPGIALIETVLTGDFLYNHNITWARVNQN